MNARRGWFRAQERGRVAVARELAKLELEAGIFCGMCSGIGDDADDESLPVFRRRDCGMCEGTGSGRHALALALLSDPAQGFNVHRAREHARSLIAMGAEHEVFVTWTRDQGRGPECREPGAFMAITKHSVFEWLPSDGTLTYGDGRSDGTQQGGLDVYHGHRKLGRLALDAGPVALASLVSELRALGFEPTIPGGWPGKLARQWGGDSRAPMGRAYAKLGRLILDALEGQPDACQAAACGDSVPKGLIPLFWGKAVQCPDCRGSGHNLRGVLAPIEWSPRVERRRREVDVYEGLHSPRCWLHDIPASSVSGPDVPRVVPRGYHRTPVVEVIERNGRRVELRDQARGWTPMWGDEPKTVKLPTGHEGPENLCDFDPDPRWRRGEDRHTEQRRARDIDRQIAAASTEVVYAIDHGTSESVGGVTMGTVLRGVVHVTGSFEI